MRHILKKHVWYVKYMYTYTVYDVSLLLYVVCKIRNTPHHEFHGIAGVHCESIVNIYIEKALPGGK